MKRAYITVDDIPAVIMNITRGEFFGVTFRKKRRNFANGAGATWRKSPRQYDAAERYGRKFPRRIIGGATEILR